MVGAGALGCEFLKGLSLMGVSTAGQTVVTDDDTIEISNLSRQFLFRRADVKHGKSERATAAARVFNPEFQVVDREERVNWENEVIFNDAFWNS